MLGLTGSLHLTKQRAQVAEDEKGAIDMGRLMGICTDPEHRGDREKILEIKAQGRCNTCYQRYYDRMRQAAAAEAPGAPRPDLSQLKYQKDLSEQRLALGKIVLILEKVTFNPSAMPEARKKSIMNEMNLALRIIDNLKHNHSVGLEDVLGVSPTPKTEDSLTSESEDVLADPAIQAEIAEQLPIPKVSLTPKVEPDLTSEVSPTSKNEVSLTSAPLIYMPNTVPDADRLFQSLLTGLPWKRYTYNVKGKSGPVPREEVWVSEHPYKYGGRIYPGWDQPGGCHWTPELLAIRAICEQITHDQYSSVLCNLYKDDNDCVSQHCDCEPTMSDAHCIASVSLGATRRFRVRRSKERDSKIGIGAWTPYNLEHGSLCIMQAGMQHDWVHEVPREKSPCGARINLTFRVYEEKE
jgi:alkylated DNA repair dioxygenase AlkB